MIKLYIAMSTQIVAVIAILLAQFLPKIGITVESKELEGTIQTIVTIVGGVWIWYQRTRLQKAPMGQGDVNVLGVRK